MELPNIRIFLVGTILDEATPVKMVDHISSFSGTVCVPCPLEGAVIVIILLSNQTTDEN